MEPNFATLYESLRPTLEQLEAKRLELKSKGTKTGLITGGICLLIGCAITIWSNTSPIGLAISLIIGLLVFAGCIHSQSSELCAYYKRNIIATLVTHLCPNARYQPEQGISEQIFIKSGLFSTPPDRYHSEDLISGQIDKTVFLCSEIVAEEKRVTHDNKGHTHTHWVDIFHGFFFVADFQKDFQGQTLVFRNTWIKLRPGRQRVKLENSEFEKSFDVYSTDQVEARYLLTPRMMEQLLTLDRKFPGKITVSFYNSNVIIAIPDSRNHFETNIWKSQLHNTDIQQEFQTLVTLLSIVNDLNLNLRIWTKE